MSNMGYYKDTLSPLSGKILHYVQADWRQLILNVKKCVGPALAHFMKEVQSKIQGTK